MIHAADAVETEMPKQHKMGIKDLAAKLEKAKESPKWLCRFHPTEYFHEVGCPHMEWTKEQLMDALSTAKAMERVYQHELWGLPLDGKPTITT